MFQSKNPTVRIASWDMKKVLEFCKTSKVSKKAIDEAIKKYPGIEFMDAVTGQTTTLAEVKQGGGSTVSIRFNQDRDQHIVKVK
jgi:hypothetical protein